MNKENEVEKAMETLLKYCKNTECENCMFAHLSCECGIHNPAAWRGLNDNK